MTAVAVRDALDQIATTSLGWQGPLPAGDLAASLDSMQRMTLVVAIEDHFAVAFDEADEGELHTVDDLVRVLLRKLGATDA